MRLHNSNLYKKMTDDSVSRWHKAVEVVACYVETCNTTICLSCEYVQRITHSSTSIKKLYSKPFWAAFVCAERKELKVHRIRHKVAKNRSESMFVFFTICNV
jgi:uncharacterized protein YlaI